MEYAKDFWTFYKLNTKDVEAISTSICKHYSSDKIDPDDMHQNLLIKLHKSDFLENFNPELSKLSTYVYGYIRHRASHVVKEMLDGVKKDNKLGIPVYIDQGHSYGDDEEVYEDIPDVKAFTPEAYAEASDMKDAISKALNSDRRQEILEYMDEGLGMSDIASAYGQSKMNISIHFSKIREVANRFFPQKESKPKPHFKEEWSNKDIDHLRKLYRTNTIPEVATKMGRSVCSIKCVLFKNHIGKK